MSWWDNLITLPVGIWALALIVILILSALLFYLRRNFEISEISISPPNLKFRRNERIDISSHGQGEPLQRKSSPKVRREYYSAIWLIGDSPDEIEGPLCKEHLLKMEPLPINYDRYSRRFSRPISFVCEICGATTQNLPTVYNEWDVKQRVYEQFLAEQRRRQSANINEA